MKKEGLFAIAGMLAPIVYFGIVIILNYRSPAPEAIIPLTLT
jgi:hypothetical protein